MKITYMWYIWAIVSIGLFAAFEGFALKHPTRQWTLSHCVAWLGAKFPLTIAILGIIFGGLLVHFFWHFCPSV